MATPSLNVTLRNGDTVIIPGMIGMSVMEILKTGGVDEVQALCGGACACATCHVYIDVDDWRRLPPPEETEEELLETSAYKMPTSRLSCQIEFTNLTGELNVTVAPAE